MSRLTLRRVDSERRYVIDDTHCGKCAGCRGGTREIHLSTNAPWVEVELSSAEQLRFLWYTWLRPVFVLVLIATLSLSIGLNEITAVVTAILGFLVSIMMFGSKINAELRIVEVKDD